MCTRGGQCVDDAGMDDEEVRQWMEEMREQGVMVFGYVAGQEECE